MRFQIRPSVGSPALALAAALVVCAVGSARGAIVVYTVNFDGPSESPANASPGIGSGTVTYDSTAHSLHLHCDFSGLLGTTTASHIHAPTLIPFTSTANVATTTPSFAGFPLGVTSGSFDNTIDLTLASSYNPAYVTAHGNSLAQSELDLTQSFAEGRAYWNIHSTVVPGGEIRGFLIPAPGLAGLVAVGGVGMLARRRRR